MKKILKIIKKIILSGFLLYGYNLIAAPLDLIIPINYITLLVTTILGIPGLLVLITVLVVVF